MQAVADEISVQVGDDDPEGTVWDRFEARLTRIEKRVMGQTPRTLSDLALQAKVCGLANRGAFLGDVPEGVEAVLRNVVLAAGMRWPLDRGRETPRRVDAPSVAEPPVGEWPEAHGADEELLQLWARYRAACADARAAGAKLPALGKSVDEAWSRVTDLEDQIENLVPVTPNLVAAISLIQVQHSCYAYESYWRPETEALEALCRVLRSVRPHLIGAISEEAEELLDGPDKPVGMMALWSGEWPPEADAANELSA